MSDRLPLPSFCFSVDVERDYRLDGNITVRGIEEGLPQFVDALRSRAIPFDLFVSGEIVPSLPSDLCKDGEDLTSLGCHGLTHPAGLDSYLGRKPAKKLRADIELATRAIGAKFGRVPRLFRAPNFSITTEALRILESLGYLCDSSILPGRRVRRWRILPLLDHRGAPSNPYHPDPLSPAMSGNSPILEVPVTSHPTKPGTPLGMGLLNDLGTAAVLKAVSQVRTRYVVFLCHTWEMVPWSASDPVASWVRTASSSPTKSIQALLDHFDYSRFVNMAQIVAREKETRRTENYQAGPPSPS